jgi:YD repeat-containing protein
MRKIVYCAAFALATVVAAPRVHAQAEVCGNGIDDNNNGLTDEGCYPTLTSGVCESPLSCGETGMMSWSTGSLHYDLPPDIAPAVPYGPGIGFRRFYTSMYTAGVNPTSVNHTPLGPNWQHTYMTWLYAFNDGTHNRIILHTSQGRDVDYVDAGACGSYECYTPQAGDHVLQLYVQTGASPTYYVQLLTGETLKYNNYGQLAEIWDTMSPTPNKVLVTWTGTSNGNVSTVTDASGERRLSFNYMDNLLTSVEYQLHLSGSWTTEHTTSFTYNNYVTRDATSGWFVPQNASEWTELLTGTGIPNPTNLWLLQETSGSLADSIGTASLAAHNSGGMSYNNAINGWSRRALELTDGSTSYWSSSSSVCNPASNPCTAVGILKGTGSISGSSSRDLVCMGDSNGAQGMVTPLTGTQWDITELWDGTHSATGSTSFSNQSVQTWVLVADKVHGTTNFTNDVTGAVPTWATGTSASGVFAIGGIYAGAGPTAYLYAAEWSNVALTGMQVTTLRNKLENGPGILTTVTIGSQLAEQNIYTNGYLSKIEDGAGTQVVAFSYSASAPGQVDLVTTSRGTVGMEYGSTRTACSGDTILYFNKGNTTSCSVDSDCGSGFLCGGKTGSGSTGTCFLAGRCMATSTVNGESVITSVSPLGPGSGSCTGACTDVMAYSWSSASNLLNVTGREDPLSNYTSATFNSNGLPTQVGYGDTDSDPTNGGYNRTAWYFYDSTYPGRIAEIRRPSDLSANASSCSGTNTTGCQRTLFCYGSSCSASCNNDAQLCTVENDGFTYDSSGSVTTYASKVTYIHDSVGRVSEIDGAVSGVKTVFDYYSGGTGALTDSFLSDYKAYSGSTTYLEPQFTSYDMWGHPTTLEDPNGSYTCDTYDSSRGYLSSRKVSMSGSSTCSGTNLTTSWTRDSWLRLTSLVRPDSSHVIYTYDAAGRLSETQRSDDGQSAADHQLVSYTPDSQVSEVDSYDASGTLTAKQPYTYGE